MPILKILPFATGGLSRLSISFGLHFPTTHTPELYFADYLSPEHIKLSAKFFLLYFILAWF